MIINWTADLIIKMIYPPFCILMCTFAWYLIKTTITTTATTTTKNKKNKDKKNKKTRWRRN